MFKLILKVFVIVTLFATPILSYSQEFNTTSDARTLESVKRTIARAKSEIFRAYSGRLSIQAGLSGRIVFNITIAPDGTVENFMIAKSTVNDEILENKINLIITKLNFGLVKSNDSTTISYTMDFH